MRRGVCQARSNYTPAAGTILSQGSHLISAIFTPTDITKYFTEASQVNVVVTQATPTITWANPPAITYGTALSAAQLNAGANTPGTFVYTPPLGMVPGSGNQTLSVTFNPSDTVNYKSATANVTLVVNKATLTVKANDVSRMYGQANPPQLTAGISGYVNGENSAVLTGIPAISTTATLASLPGPYPIVVTQGTLAAANYMFAFVNGTLTVTPTAPAPPSGTTCNGAYTGTFQGDVQVSSGQNCIFVNGGGPTGIGTVERRKCDPGWSHRRQECGSRTAGL